MVKLSDHRPTHSRRKHNLKCSSYSNTLQSQVSSLMPSCVLSCLLRVVSCRVVSRCLRGKGFVAVDSCSTGLSGPTIPLYGRGLLPRVSLGLPITFSTMPHCIERFPMPLSLSLLQRASDRPPWVSLSAYPEPWVFLGLPRTVPIQGFLPSGLGLLLCWSFNVPKPHGTNQTKWGKIPAWLITCCNLENRRRQ